jgi:hypothetical protein
MRAWCPAHRFVRVARLDDHQLMFTRRSERNGSGVADVVPEAGLGYRHRQAPWSSPTETPGAATSAAPRSCMASNRLGMQRSTGLPTSKIPDTHGRVFGQIGDATADPASNRLAFLTYSRGGACGGAEVAHLLNTITATVTNPGRAAGWRPGRILGPGHMVRPHRYRPRVLRPQPVRLRHVRDSPGSSSACTGRAHSLQTGEWTLGQYRPGCDPSRLRTRWLVRRADRQPHPKGRTARRLQADGHPRHYKHLNPGRIIIRLGTVTSSGLSARSPIPIRRPPPPAQSCRAIMQAAPLERGGAQELVPLGLGESLLVLVTVKQCELSFGGCLPGQYSTWGFRSHSQL